MTDFYISTINIAERRTVTNTNSDTSYYVLYAKKKRTRKFDNRRSFRFK